MPMPIPIPVDSTKERQKKMKKMAFLDWVLCYPRDTPREIQAAISWRTTPIIKFTKTDKFFVMPSAIPSKIQ
jgi:hypothetical protein